MAVAAPAAPIADAAAAVATGAIGAGGDEPPLLSLEPASRAWLHERVALPFTEAMEKLLHAEDPLAALRERCVLDLQDIAACPQLQQVLDQVASAVQVLFVFTLAVGLIVLDMSMPGLSGPETLRELRRRGLLAVRSARASRAAQGSLKGTCFRQIGNL